LALLSVEPAVREIFNQNTGKPFLNLTNSLEVIHQIGVPVSLLHLAENEERAITLGKKLGYPLVAKVASDEVVHKTEKKGVYAGIADEKELIEAYKSLSRIKGAHGCYLQKMVSGYEVIIGAKRDPIFGTVLMIGVGGIFTELFKSVSSRAYPFSTQDFEEMLAESRLKALISGFRGAKPIDSQQLFSVVSKIGALMARFPEITEIDINPLFISSEQIAAVDCRIIL
ncbi:hypothetical protein HGB07_08310, partial [Candidatus Roizmanbacteria bacterium]|nr:hypothetical protein [Candidatus Roizmanbacteria bacterium]